MSAVIIGSYIEFSRRRFAYENFSVKVRTNMTGGATAPSARVRVPIGDSLCQPLAPFGKKKRAHTYIYIHTHGAWGSVVVKTLRYKSVGPGIDSKR